MALKTVKVKRKDHPNDFVVINECDMTKDDVLFGEEAPKKEAKKPTKKK